MGGVLRWVWRCEDLRCVVVVMVVVVDGIDLESRVVMDGIDFESVFRLCKRSASCAGGELKGINNGSSSV